MHTTVSGSYAAPRFSVSCALLTVTNRPVSIFIANACTQTTDCLIGGEIEMLNDQVTRSRDSFGRLQCAVNRHIHRSYVVEMGSVCLV